MTITRSRDSFLLAATLLAFGFWLAAIGPVRTWASHAGMSANWAVGVAPSFFAGFTFVLWYGFSMRGRPLAAVLYGTLLIVVGELAQIFIPRYTPDAWDVAAGIIGTFVAAPIVSWRAQRTPVKPEL